MATRSRPFASGSHHPHRGGLRYPLSSPENYIASHAKTASFMAESQVPWGLDALTGSVTQAAWKTKPSWYLVAKDDHMIPPDAQRFMSKRAGATVVETKGSHAVYVSHPAPVAALIERAAAKITTTASR